MSLQANRNHTPASSVKRESFYYGWIVLVALLVMTTISFGVCYSFGVFFKSLATDFDLNRAATSAIMSLYMLLCAVMAIGGGWLVDRFGARKTVAAMGFFTGLSLLLTSQASLSWHLYLSYSLLLAMGTGATMVKLLSSVMRNTVR